MRKMIFAALAAFVVSFCLVSCNNSQQKDKTDGEAEEKTEAKVEDESADEIVIEETDQPHINFTNALEKLATVLEGTHIKSVDDVQALKEKVEKIREVIMVSQSEMQNDFRDRTEAEMKEINSLLEGKTKKIIEKGENESKRLMEEAKAAGISEEELEFLE